MASPAGSAGPTRVVLKDIAFRREVTRIRAGQRVTWEWQDRFSSHNVRSVGRPRFRGATERRQGMHTVRFTRGGRYRYVCTLHPGMRGTIVVR